jgi:acyl-coenzyme A thioesterase PaaI-like protein
MGARALHQRRPPPRRRPDVTGRQNGCRLRVPELPDGAGTTTIESKTNFLRGVRAGEAHDGEASVVVATSRALHTGRKVIVVETDLRDGAERLVARVTQTQMVLGS